ncbi:MAG: hypothetical protein V4772_20770 [Pseudomonadota bacterium]
MANNSVAEASTAKAVEPVKASDLCVVEVGQYSRKQIKRLRKGEGKLLSNVEQIIQDMKDDGVLTNDSNTVVLVVRQEVSLRTLMDDED